MSVNAEFKVSAPPFRWDGSGGILILACPARSYST